MQIFLSGLKDCIVVEVELHHPNDLSNAMSQGCMSIRVNKKLKVLILVAVPSYISGFSVAIIESFARGLPFSLALPLFDHV